ncbi:MAG: hypothetical protein U0556_03765 [Dehalococcoidia bacterium]
MTHARRPSLNPRPSPPVHSCLYSVGMMSIGALLTVAALAGAGYLAFNNVIAQFTAPLTYQAAPAEPTPTQLPSIQALPISTPVVDPDPEPTARPTSRYDVQLRISEPYLNVVDNQSIPSSGLGAGVDAVDLDIKPGNIIALRARPIGARDLALTFTGQMSLQGNYISVTPLASSLLLLPFRGQVADVVEQSINARLNVYRNAVGFRILAIQTTESDLIIDVRLG